VTLSGQRNRQIKACFVAAPGGLALDTLHDSLLAHNIRPLVPQELFAGRERASEIQRELLEADLVVGILLRGKQSPWVLLGMQMGPRKRDHRLLADVLFDDAALPLRWAVRELDLETYI